MIYSDSSWNGRCMPADGCHSCRQSAVEGSKPLALQLPSLNPLSLLQSTHGPSNVPIFVINPTGQVSEEEYVATAPTATLLSLINQTIATDCTLCHPRPRRGSLWEWDRPWEQVDVAIVGVQLHPLLLPPTPLARHDNGCHSSQCEAVAHMGLLCEAWHA